MHFLVNCLSSFKFLWIFGSSKTNIKIFARKHMYFRLTFQRNRFLSLEVNLLKLNGRSPDQ